MPTQVTWDPITTAMLALIAWFLRVTVKELIEKVKAHDEILKKVVTEDDCEKNQKDCENCPDWGNFRKHYHTGTGPGSGVVIP